MYRLCMLASSCEDTGFPVTELWYAIINRVITFPSRRIMCIEGRSVDRPQHLCIPYGCAPLVSQEGTVLTGDRL